MKKDKIKYNCLTGIILIIFNISMKFLIYGNTAIWLDDMPTYPSEERLSPEIEIFKKEKRVTPILILDDLFSELDEEKINNIMLFIDDDIQTFITTTELDKVNDELKKESRIFYVENGNVKEGIYE